MTMIIIPPGFLQTLARAAGDEGRMFDMTRSLQRIPVQMSWQEEPPKKPRQHDHLIQRHIRSPQRGSRHPGK